MSHLKRPRVLTYTAPDRIQGGTMQAFQASCEKWSRRLGSVRAGVGRWGFLRVAHIYLMKALAPRLYLSFAFVGQLGSRPVHESQSGCAIRVPSHDEIIKASADPALELTKDFVEAALERGDLCMAAFDGEKLVAYTWRAFRYAPHVEGVWVRFSKPYRYAYKTFTLPAYRGRHLQEAIAPLTDRLCIERGFTHGIGFVETHNYASLTMTARMGARKVGVLGYIRLFGRILTFRSPGARRHGFGFSSVAK